MSVEGKENDVNTDALRAELKSWENAFKQENGRKPGRADIKNDATIASKYKLYDRITRREQPALNQTPKKSARPRTKDTTNEDMRPHRPSATPRKSPSKNGTESQPPLQTSPFDEIEATPAHIKCALGPTPLKDGQMLGIFDFLSATPSRDQETQKTGIETLVAGTPSKGAPASSDHAFSKTPQSASKRRFLDAFAGTPLKRKREEEDVGKTSSSKKQFPTPAFLRRSFPMASIDEEGEGHSTARPPFRKRGLVRSLSSIIQGLKKQEDERMDDEWDIMREIEEEEEGEGEITTTKAQKEASKVLVQDSQAPEMPLGPDQAPVSEYEDTDEEAKNAGRKPWKKKGLKRQTKRTKMKPVVHKAKKADEVHEFDEDETEIVPETQVADDPKQGLDGDESSGSDANEENKRKDKKSTAKGKEKESSGKEASKKPRKVNPDAHANFRRLNIKNKNSKANGRGKRFGRR